MKAMVSLQNEGTKEMFMRFAISLYHKDGEMKQLLETFARLCGFEFNLSTAAYRNAGLANRQFASCFLLTLEDDFEHVITTLCDMKKVMKNGSAVGIGLSKIRAKGSLVEGSSTVACGPVAIANEINAAVMTVLSRDGKTFRRRRISRCLAFRYFGLSIQGRRSAPKYIFRSNDSRRVHEEG